MIDQEIARRMDAYRGNPQALMQRYQQSQQLLDLLALQKLKSEKEAALREMQLAQGPQGGLPTVAEQREQELLDMTKQELASQVGGVARQQQQAMQGNMQKLMSGIARAPGAQNVMPPQAMAAGGIVAFQEGGNRGLSEADENLRRYGSPYLSAEERARYRKRRETNPYPSEYPLTVPEIREMYEGLLPQQRAIRGAMMSEPEAQAQLRAARERLLFAPQSMSEARLRMEAQLDPTATEDLRRAPPPAAPPQVPLSPEEKARLQTMGGVSRAAPARSAERPEFEETLPPEVYLPGRGLPSVAAARQRQDDQGAAAPAAARPAAPPAPAAPAAPAAPSPFADTVKSAIAGSFGDPVEDYRRLEAMYPQMSAAEKAAAAQRMQRRRAMVEEQFDPRRQGIEQLLRMGAAFGRGLTPGTAAPSTAEVGLDYAARQRAARAQAEEGLMGLEEKQAAEELAGRRAAAEAGTKAYQESVRRGTAALGAGASIVSAETKAEVDKLQSENLRIANELKAKELTHTKLMSIQGTLLGKLAETERKIRDDVAGNPMVAMQRGALLSKLQQNPNDTKARDALKVFDDDLRAAVENNSAVRESRRLLEFVNQQLGMPSAPAAASTSAPSTAGFRITSVK